jgi:hypothetical protein
VPLTTGFPARILGSRDMRSCQLIIDHIMQTIMIYFLRADGKLVAASSYRLPPAGLLSPGPEAAQGLTSPVRSSARIKPRCDCFCARQKAALHIFNAT